MSRAALPDKQLLREIAGQFRFGGRIADISEHGRGNINKTFLVTLDDEGGCARYFILQEINTKVFVRPELVMKNFGVCTEHIKKSSLLLSSRRWETPRVILTNDGYDHYCPEDRSFWRALSFIENSEAPETVQNDAHARQVGEALGIFHAVLSDLPPEKLYDTLEGFHVTPLYLQHYDSVVSKPGCRKSAEINFCHDFIRQRRPLAAVLEKAKAMGLLKIRAIHGDPKVNNILIDRSTAKAVGIIDLDTVKPGLIQYDIGDCIRSAGNRFGEETGDWEKVCLDADILREVMRGYLSASEGFLSQNDILHIYDSIRVIAFELGLRFITDYLEGNVYFKVSQPDQNLLRALVQFKLTESIEMQESNIQTIIRESQ